MYQYPKQILTITQQVQSYIDAGMTIISQGDVEKALKSIGFYRLRGYSFHQYDNATKKYVPETKFEDGIKKTIQWYLDNKEWWETIISGEYQNYYEKMYGNR